jgi:hypothetical protein
LESRHPEDFGNTEQPRRRFAPSVLSPEKDGLGNAETLADAVSKPRP